MITDFDDGFLKALLENADEAIEVADTDIRFEYVNPAFERITGYDKAEVIGKTSAEILRPYEADEEVYRHVVQTVAAGEVWKGELVSRRKDGSPWISEATISPVRDATGEITRYIAVRRDVTDRKRAERNLRESEASLANAQQIAKLGSWERDVATEKIIWSDQEYRMYGYEPNAVTPTLDLILSAVHPEDRKRFLADREGILATSSSVDAIRDGVEGQYRIARPDGSEIWLEQIARIMRDQDGRAIRLVGTDQDITERKRTEQDLRISDERFRALLADSDLGFLIRQGPKLVYANQTFADLFGYNNPAEILALDSIERLRPAEEIDRLAKISDARERGVPTPSLIEFRGLRKDGSEVWLETRVQEITWNDTPSLLTASVDISERKATENQLRQAQKMAAVGQLTGGVAHDFNNLLAIIMGNTELVQDELEAESEPLRLISQAAERGAELVHRLLAFSRQQLLAPRTIDPGALVDEMGDLLRRTLDETIEVEISSEPDLWHAKADPGQLESALLNLALNARDAMRQGGKLSIKNSNATFDEAYSASHPEVAPGDYVLISVSDSGSGMSSAVHARALEPFFTTKDVGEGSGLGLSMVYGFTRQSGGDLAITTEEGLGTTVKLYLPRAGDQGERTEPSGKTEIPHGRGETVLVIED